VEALEGSGRLGPHASDLPSGRSAPDEQGSEAAEGKAAAWMKRHRVYAISGAIMSIFAAVALIIGVQSSGAVEGQASPPATVTSAAPATPAAKPAPGTEAALRSLVAGLASGSPDYDKLSPAFADIVRRDLPMTHRWFAPLGKLESVTFRRRGAAGDDVYELVFAKGEVTMSARLDAEGRMQGGLLQPVRLPER
jgi:hypothetical protein